MNRREVMSVVRELFGHTSYMDTFLLDFCTFKYSYTCIYNTKYKRSEDMYKSESSLKPLVNYLYRNEINKQSAANEFVFR